VCLDRVSLLVMWTQRNLKLSTCSNYTPVVVHGGVLGPPYPVVHDQLLTQVIWSLCIIMPILGIVDEIVYSEVSFL
jgi:hypothetical protein